MTPEEKFNAQLELWGLTANTVMTLSSTLECIMVGTDFNHYVFRIQTVGTGKLVANFKNNPELVEFIDAILKRQREIVEKNWRLPIWDA